MKGFLFQNPAFLFGLSALAIPIIIHLINRNVPKRIIFSSIRFIQKSHQLKTGKKYIRDWWVLLTRLLLLTIVILLFASPMIAVERRMQGNGIEEVLLFFDLSVSMNIENFSDFVQDQTQEILKIHPKSRFALIASSNKIEKSLPFNTPVVAISQAVEELKPGLVVGDHQDAFLTLQKLFNHDKNVKKTIYIFSDIQRQDWSTSRLPSLDLDAEVKFIKPPHSDSANIAVSGVFPELYVKDGVRRLRATVEVRNYSLQPATVQLQLTAGDAVESKEIALRGDYHEKFVVDLKNPTANVARAEITVDEPFLIDNSYYFWIGPKAPVKTGIMADVQSRSKATEVFFLRNALSISLPGTETYDADVIAPDYIWDSPLTEFQCLFILDAISSYTDAELQVFHDYLVQGGTLVYFSGKNTASNIAKLNQSKISKVRFLGYQGEINQLQSYSVTSLEEGSPIVSLFEKERGDLFQFPIYKFAKLSPSQNSITLLTAANRYPLLLKEEVEKGNLFILSVSLAPNWSEFPTSLSFLPLIHQIVGYNVQGRKRGIIEFTIGDEIPEEFSDIELSEDIQLPQQPGVELVQNIPVETNITRAESDFHAVEQYEVANRLTSKQMQKETVEESQHFEGGSSHLKKPLAWMLLCFFTLELLLANRRKKGRLAF